MTKRSDGAGGFGAARTRACLWRFSAVIVCLLVFGCSSGPATGGAAPASPTPTAKPSPVSAKAIAGRPADFGPQALTECSSPETGDFAGFAAAYRTGIPFHDRLAAVATIVAQANADNWVTSLAAPDASPAVCHGALGFAYTPRQQGKEPTLSSFVFVFTDSGSAQSAYAQIQPTLVARPGKTGVATGLGPNSALADSGDIQFVVWQHGAVVSYLLTQDVDNWSAGAKAIDTRAGP